MSGKCKVNAAFYKTDNEVIVSFEFPSDTNNKKQAYISRKDAKLLIKDLEIALAEADAYDQKQRISKLHEERHNILGGSDT